MKNKLHKLGFYLFLGIGILGTTFTSCSSDDNGVTNIAVAKEDYQSLTGEEVTIDPKIGRAGATYTWYNHRESKTIGDQEILKHTFAKPGKYNLSLKVEEAGALDIYTYTVTVDKNYDYNYVVTDLTEINLSDGISTAGGKIWKDTFTDDAELKTGIFNIKHIAINEWHTWMGFTVSNSTDSADHINSEGGWVKNQWGTMAGGAVNGAGKPFLVSFADHKPHPNLLDPTKPVPLDRFSSVITIDDQANTYKAVSTQVAISPWPYYGILKGDAFARKFEKGDYFALHIYGVDADNMLTSDTPVTHYFVDFRNGVNEINTDWSKVDLSSLGEVKHLVFFLETTDVGDWGANTALYFTMDQLTVDKVE
ncbi:DUF4465 domain-containing protein [Myroides pelagicus]|uniref:DUF4465 domain-containing protein n=1 Tax=Myroides pelagicus TaxID=270914 RepID=A0A7K1GKX3_9FLAO|nr:DUF4465 domain-containing protein [Myroides pelagicus]MTH29535.1 DUF4465 domain-containing protein [Myroides pelagicus]